ncbi:hypothetical protein RV04_GL000668 [Enterococcus hermanniensis]|uniref:Uncharacterized protein n=1 Tax=Enterococcus hermanniensis TaxID=249189 RepID=A0A1L8TGK0_9ENTE|nr:hypothetical protein RV04_GL000668 [Enterococcus hermanniensis]
MLVVMLINIFWFLNLFSNRCNFRIQKVNFSIFLDLDVVDVADVKKLSEFTFHYF